ncbi:MAG: hypothetical protein JXR10_15285 [Cyclobacteriaceae bacterium]
MVETFQNYHQKHSLSSQTNERKSFRLSLLRGAAFIVGSLLFITYFRASIPFLWVGALTAYIVFYWLYLKHKQVEAAKHLDDTLTKINEEEIKKAALDLGSFEEGQEFIEPNHPYQIDLDIFGKHSLYQLVNRCELYGSKEQLAHWLSKPGSTKEIGKRQEAVKELAPKTEWRQHLQATIRIAQSTKKKRDPDISPEDLTRWISGMDVELNARFWRVLSIVLTSTTIMTLLAITLGPWPYQSIYLPLIASAIFLGFGAKKLTELTQNMTKAFYLVHSYAAALRMVEATKFESSRMTFLQSQLRFERESATVYVEQLAKLTHRLGARSNMLYAILDIPFLLDNHLLLDILNWKKQHYGHLQTWMEVIHEIECLMSIAGFSFSNPTFSFPEIKQSFTFSAQQIGHPLITDKEKIKNDYSIEGKGSVDVITGSNMSGKSTFERTIGINMVLAQAGCPVDAESLNMSPAQVFTSMRTSDNLEEHTSSFYAELKRIVLMLETVENQSSTFFILDEILKGTNSQDRHAGSVALIKKLIGKNAFGLISTHDLELGSLETEHPSVRNFSFNSTLENDKIIFDYKLTEGVCRSFNASQLMKNMGIL